MFVWVGIFFSIFSSPPINFQFLYVHYTPGERQKERRRNILIAKSRGGKQTRKPQPQKKEYTLFF